MLTLTLEPLKGLWKSLQGITKHYERRMMVRDVYEEIRRYTITMFTDETKKP
jgi:hypothetical protein